MAKVMISMPDELLAAVDAEATRRGVTRSALLQDAARGQVGLLRRDRDSILGDLDRISALWAGPLDAGEMIRADRHRDDEPGDAELLDRR